jgi:hypothetical protein
MVKNFAPPFAFLKQFYAFSQLLHITEFPSPYTHTDFKLKAPLAIL